MLDLVLWSFVMALSPLALGLAWKLARGVGSAAHQGHTQDPVPSSGAWRRQGMHSVHAPSAPRPVSRVQRWW